MVPEVAAAAEEPKAEAPKAAAQSFDIWEEFASGKPLFKEDAPAKEEAAKAAEERKEQIALRVDKDVLEWYRSMGTGWQTRMNAVLKAFRDATV